MYCLKPKPSIKMIDLFALLGNLPKENLGEDGKLVKYAEVAAKEPMPKYCRIYFGIRQYNPKGLLLTILRTIVSHSTHLDLQAAGSLPGHPSRYGVHGQGGTILVQDSPATDRQRQAPVQRRRSLHIRIDHHRGGAAEDG